MSKARKIAYWVATLWLSLGMLSSAVVQLIRMEDVVHQFAHLGYPIYLLTLLGVLKILGVIVILVPGIPLLKEWAYAGFSFAMFGAFVSHLAVGDPIGEIIPSLLTLVLTLVSWYLRPPSRSLVAASTNQTI
jgi:hypothetical protein